MYIITKKETKKEKTMSKSNNSLDSFYDKLLEDIPVIETDNISLDNEYIGKIPLNLELTEIPVTEENVVLDNYLQNEIMPDIVEEFGITKASILYMEDTNEFCLTLYMDNDWIGSCILSPKSLFFTVQKSNSIIDTAKFTAYVNKLAELTLVGYINEHKFPS